MAITVRRVGIRGNSLTGIAQARAHNALHVALVGANVHADALQYTPGSLSEPGTPTALLITQPSAVDLPSAQTLLTACLSYLTQHWNDAIAADTVEACGAHKVVDTTNLAAIAGLSVGTLASAISAANALKSAFNAHLSQAGIHFNNDGTSTISTSNASDLPSLLTLANAIKTQANLHTQLAPAGIYMVRTVP